MAWFVIALLAVAVIWFRLRKTARQRLAKAREHIDSSAPVEGTALLLWADHVVGAYADMLQTNKTGLWIPESALPASLADVKHALVVTAADKLAKGLITEHELDVYRSGYVNLMNVVSDDQASRAADLMGTANAFKESAAQSDEELARTLERFSASADLFNQHPTNEGVVLIREFDSRVATLVARQSSTGAA